MKVRYAPAVLFGLALSGPMTPLVLLHGAEGDTATLDATAPLNLVPWPRQVQTTGGRLVLGEDARVVAEDDALLPLGRVLTDEIRAVSGLRLTAATGLAKPGDIVLRLTQPSTDEAYTLRVDNTVTVEGGNYVAVALGTTTLLQLFHVEPGGVALPRLAIEDRPYSSYRGLLIDVARKYHSLDTLRQCVRLCRQYKIRYLQLHLTDDPAFTFPSRAYPQLTTQNWHGGPAYTLEELKELESYAAERGVAIVPEFEVPGHAGAMNRTMPELFKIRGTKPYEHHATINFANANVLRAVETIVGEMCEVFRSSPYFHIGGDEADFVFAHQHPEFQAAFRRFELGEKGQWQLYRHFLIRMNEIVRKHGKQMIVWEGFHRDPGSKFQIPKDVIVMEYECPFYPPQHLVEDGYRVVNACWTPLYVVNQKRWSPEQIYDWNLFRFGQHTTQYAATVWHQLEATPQIIGAQMCAWEQPEAIEVASLRTRLPAMSERIWNPDADRDYADFARRAAAADRLLSKLNPSVRIRAAGLAAEDRNDYNVPRFHERLTVTIESELPASEIRYTLDGQTPISSLAAEVPDEAQDKFAPRAASSLTYRGIIVIEKTTTIRAAAFDAQGQPVGHPAGDVFYLDETPH